MTKRLGMPLLKINGPKTFSYGKVPKTAQNRYNIEVNNRNLATFNMLNWYTHNSYLEIPLTQRQALYFDSRAESAIADSISSVGQTLSGNMGVMGMGGVIGGAFGGPLGAVFGAALGMAGSSILGKIFGAGTTS